MKKLEIIRKIFEENSDAKIHQLFDNSDVLNLTILANLNKNNLTKNDLNFLLKYDKFLVWDSTTEDDFEEYVDFSYINYHPYGILISKYPELINEISSNKLETFSEWDWARIISYQPKLISKCKKLNDFNCSQWALILKRQPQLIDKCSKIELFKFYEISNIVAHQPDLISILPSIEKIKPIDLAILIRNRPEFIEELNINLDKLTNELWTIILLKQPQLINKCSIIKNLNPDNWEVILSKQPQLSIKCKKFESFSGMNWDSLVIKQPIFLDLAYKYIYQLGLGKISYIIKTKIVVNHPELIERFVTNGIPEFEFISDILLIKQSKENRLNILKKYTKYIKTNNFTNLIGIYSSEEMKELYTKKNLWQYVDFNQLSDNLEYSILK